MRLFVKSASTVVPWPETLVFETLADYGNWSEWLLFLSSSRLLTREGKLAIAELGWMGNGETAVECIQMSDKALQARVIDGRAPLRELELQVAPAGGSDTEVRLSFRFAYDVSAFWSMWRPDLNPARCLAALKTMLRQANPGPETVPGAENIFELWDSQEGLICWVRGCKYRLVPFRE